MNENALARRFAGAVSFALLSGLIGFAGMFQVEVQHMDVLQMVPIYLLAGASGISKLGMIFNQKRAPLSFLAMVTWVIVFLVANRGGPPPVVFNAPPVYAVMGVMTILWWLFVDIVESFWSFQDTYFHNQNDRETS